MTTVRQKKSNTELMGMYFLEIGGICTAEEYRNSGHVPMRWSQIKRLFGNWNRMLKHIESAQPEIWQELHNPKPKVAIPKVAAKPAKPVKVAVEAE